jgi:hypothetical protein
MMQYFVITTSEQLEALHTCLLSRRYAQRAPVGHFVHGIYFEGFNVADNAETHVTFMLISMIMNMPRLQRYQSQEWITGRAELVCLSTMCASTLTHLHVQIRSAADGLFPIINAFERMEILWLALEFGPWLHSSAHPLNLPLVTDVSWQVEYAGEEEDDPAMAAFLARCSFAPRCSMDITILGLQPSSATQLRPLFVRHRIVRLIIVVPPASMSALAAETLAVESLRFEDVLPPLSLLDTSTLPKSLALQYPLTEDDQQKTHFWDILNYLSSSAHTPNDTTTLRFMWKQHAEFDWLAADGVEDGVHAAFVGRLMQVAVPLSKRGFRVVDRHDRDFTSLFVQ